MLISKLKETGSLTSYYYSLKWSAALEPILQELKYHFQPKYLSLHDK